MDLSRCTLRKLRLERCGKDSDILFRVVLPDSLEVLELRELRPWRVKVRTLCVDLPSFRLLNPEEQASLKTDVPNLFVLEQMQARSRYFASSFVSEK